jgi:hypothetical protein
MSQRILTNSIRCKHCGGVIESRHRHDFVPCKCGAVFVDGGRDYLRRGFRTSPDDDYEELSTYDQFLGGIDDQQT